MKINVAAAKDITGYIARSAEQRRTLTVIKIPFGIQIEGSSADLERLVLSVDDSLDIAGCCFADPTFVVYQAESDFPFACDWLKEYKRER